MKKILLSLLMLFGMTAVWAGTGSGSKFDPYTGEWQVSELAPKLKKGDYLSYECILKSGNITVRDSKLSSKAEEVITEWADWAVGSTIIQMGVNGNFSTNDNYTEYLKYNIPFEAIKQSFVIDDVQGNGGTQIVITGYFTGTYPTRQPDGFWHVGSGTGLEKVIEQDNGALIKLTDDIEISNLRGPFCDTFSGTIDGYYTTHLGDSTIYCCHRLYAGETVKELVTDDKGEKKIKIKYRTRTECTYLFRELNHATIKNVVLSNISVDADDNDNIDKSKDELGVLARRAVNGCSFSNVTLDYCYVDCAESRGGIMLGYAENCTFQLVNIKNSVIYVGELEGGGIVGHSDFCTYEMCVTSFDTGVWVDGVNGSTLCARSGGFVGYSYKDTFINGINAAFVGADESQVGGFTGESKYSNFTNCINVGYVAHIDRDDFTGKRSDRNRKLDDYEFDSTDFGWLVGGSVSGGLFVTTALSMVASETSSLLVSLAMSVLYHGTWAEMSFLPDIPLFTLYEVTTYLPVFASFCVGTTVILTAIAAAIAISIDIAGGDDEVGGISGLAVGGNFERCQNYVPLKCRDDNLGGIVGLGQGVTINNCFNSASLERDEDDTTGDILGKAEPNPEEGGKKCLVTNCLSTDAYHIVGDEDYDEGMDPASGNNYRPDHEKYNGERVLCEEPVERELINSGLVSWWLNQGVENRSIGAKPWRKGITENIGKRNVLDPSLPEVTIDDLNPYEIDSPDKLYNFATQVNIGHKHAVGVLTADIDMSGYPSIPIGIGEELSFCGIFDGQGHTISGLDYSTDADMGVGLFGVVQAGAEIRNVTVKNSKFSHANDYGAAGIVGRISIGSWGNVVIENCASYADVHAKTNAGGILGRVYTGQDAGPNISIYVDNCYNGGTITAEGGNSGLLCGYTKDNGHVSNSWSDGQLRNGDNKGIWPYSIENDKDNPVAECLVGYNTDLDIKDCYIVNPEVNVDQYEKFKDQYPLQAGVEIVSDEGIATGEFTYKLNGNTNDVTKGLTWQQNLGKDACPVPGNKGLYHTRSVSSKYGTVCLPYSLQSDDDIKYYQLSTVTTADGEVKLQFRYTEFVDPGTPVVFASTTGDHSFIDCFHRTSIDFALSTEVVEGDWKMHGHPVEKVFEGDDAKTVYYLTGDKFKNAKKTTVAPYHAYFRGPSIETLTAAGAKAISIVLEDEDGMTTGLEFVGEDLVPVQQGGKAYTIMGTEANEGYRGILIKNGKKVLQTAKP